MSTTLFRGGTAVFATLVPLTVGRTVAVGGLFVIKIGSKALSVAAKHMQSAVRLLLATCLFLNVASMLSHASDTAKSPEYGRILAFTEKGVVTAKTVAEHGGHFGVRLHNIRYTSPEGDVIGVLGIPDAPPPKEGWAIISSNHGTSGGDTRFTAGLDDSVANWTMEGYVTIATQYRGIGTPGPHWYMIALPQAHSIFDGIRATLKLNDYLKQTLVRNDVIIGGVSQGGHATLSAAKYHRDYAPEINVLGFAPSSFGDLFLLMSYFTSEQNKHTPSWAVRWYQYQTEMRHLKVPNPFSSDEMYDKVKKWAHETPFAQGRLLQYAGTDYEHVFAPEFYKAAMSNKWDALPAWKEFIEGNLPIPSTKRPIILTTGGRDPYIVEERARGLYQRIKQAGNDILTLADSKPVKWRDVGSFLDDRAIAAGRPLWPTWS